MTDHLPVPELYSQNVSFNTTNEDFSFTIDDLGKNASKFEIFKDFILSGVSSLFVYSDYSFGVLLLNAYLLRGGDVQLGAAASYTITFINLSIFAIDSGNYFILQIYTGQCLAKKKFRKMNLYLRQTVLFNFLHFFIFHLLCSYLLPML